MNKKVKKLLTMVLCTAMVLSLVTIPAFAAGSVNTSNCDGNHNFVITSSGEGYDCTYGHCEYAVEKCSKCGLTRHTALRSWETSGGTHTYEQIKFDTGCSANPTIWNYCTRCGHSELVETGGHDWNEGAIVGSTTCTGGGTRTDTCKNCSETRVVNLPTTNKHTWRLEETVGPTCGEAGYKLFKCETCGAEDRVPSGLMQTDHRWVNKDGSSCTGEQECAICGATRQNPGHSPNAGYERNSTEHWHVCTNCGEKLDVEEHYFLSNGKCVCGYVKPTTSPAKCTHTWTIQGRTSSFTHKEVCTKCGAERSVNCSESTFVQPRTSCLQPLICQCGNTSREGQKNHNYGTTWTAETDAHSKKCLNPGCNNEYRVPHELETVANGAYTNYQCHVCGVVVRSVKKETNSTAPGTTTSTSHTHSYSAWISDGANTHTRTCNVHGCNEKQTEPHTVGPADCTGKATCTRCGATVTTTKGTNHVGGTEIRNEKAAAVGVAGYTGDTYCKGCGEKIATGTTIKELEASHTHTYHIIKHDSTGHWYECDCGAKDGKVDKHTGGTATCASGAKCEICDEVYGAKSNVHVGGTKVTNHRAAQVGVEGYTGDTCCVGCGAVLLKGETIPALTETHTHIYDQKKHDSTGHWMECGCGAKQEKSEHTYKDGVCTVCGEKEPIKVEEHVHSYSTEWKGDSTNHWHVCESCGLVADKSVHAFVNGKCIDCGMTVEVKNEKEAEEEKAKVEAEANHVNAVAVFKDVQATAFYAEAVQTVMDRNIMKGVSGSSFSPNTQTKRRQLVTILARMSGVDTDVTNTPWYYPGLAWASALGINEGYPDEDNKDVTREELVVMMYRTAGSPTVSGDLSEFADASKVSSEEAKNAFIWAVDVGVITGKKSGSTLNLDPSGTTTRGEIATVVDRYLEHKGM